MGIASIRLAVRTLVDGAAGINEVLARPPESVGAVPVAWLGDATAEVTMGQSEVWSWTLPLTVAVARKANYAMEQEATEGLIAALMAQVRTNYTLAGTTFGLALVRFQEGIVRVGDTELVGFTMVFRVKEKTAQTLTG